MGWQAHTTDIKCSVNLPFRFSLNQGALVVFYLTVFLFLLSRHSCRGAIFLQ
jgi:hypothetical protein